MEYKVIFAGRLEFGTSRSYEKVLKQFEHRRENYYRNDVLFQTEDIFIEDEQALYIERSLLRNVSQKSWQNTVNILKQVAQYAVAGDINAWKLNVEGLVKHLVIEPETEKTAVQAYRTGRELVQEKGREEEAYAALTRAIDKFSRHALAYERRGYVNFKLGNLEDALYDYNKSIDINPHKPEPYMGRAMIYLKKKDLTALVDDLDNVLKYSIPHQPMYWNARLMKAEKLLEMSRFEEAAYEYRLFVKRNLAEDHPLQSRRRRAHYEYAKALMATGKAKEARDILDAALKTPEAKGAPSNAEILVQRGLAGKEAGTKGYREDWKKAAGQGSKKAEKLLAEH